MKIFLVWMIVKSITFLEWCNLEPEFYSEEEQGELNDAIAILHDKLLGMGIILA